MLKKLGVVIPSVVLTLLMAVGFSTPAFAYVEPEVKEEPVQVIEEEEPTEEEKIPFTIAGNGEVEDNIMDDLQFARHLALILRTTHFRMWQAGQAARN